jgi:hypothetical protein
MANIIFPTNTTPITPTRLDLVMISDESDGGKLKEATLDDVVALTPPPEWGDIEGTLSDQTDLQSALDGKQDDLVSGTNIKTVNSNSLVGSWNVSVGDVTLTGTETLTNKTISLANNTITGTKAQFDTAVSDGNICFDGDSVTNLNMATARILGRTTASTGAVEEITVGAWLSLSGGTLSASWSSGTKHKITIPWQVVLDANNYQGLYLYNDTGATITITNVDIAVGIAAAGSWAACTVQLYKSSGTAADGLNTNAVALFSSAIALGSANTSLNNVPNTATVESGRWVTLRVTASAGATNFASDLQCIITY